MMITATIVVTPKACYIDYRVSTLDVLEYVGTGIEIYVRKPHKLRYSERRRSTIDYMAVLVAQEHKIPLISVKRVNIKESRKPNGKTSDKQLKLL